MLRIDHVVYAVADLDEAATRFREAFGLDSVAGGRHERWGTANRIVPLGDDYLELVAAVARDAAAAAGGFGRAVMDRADAGGGWITLAVTTDDLGAVAGRLGLEMDSGSRTRPDGEVVRWRMAGLDDPRREPWLPFFLAWDVPDELHPGRARAGHGVRAVGIAWVEVAGDAERLRAWLDGEKLPIRVIDGERGIRRVAVATSEAEIVIE
jgi:Glyoxalase-like domain